MKNLHTLLFAGALAITVPAIAHADLISDGNFSSPSGGGSYQTYGGSSSMGPWKVTGNGVDLIGGYWQAPIVGGGSVDLNALGSGGLTQSFSTVAGRLYQVSFYLSGNPDGGNQTDQLAVSVGDVSNRPYAYTTGSNSRSDMQYELKSFTFHGNPGTTTLAFNSAGPNNPFGPVIGGVSVTAAPEPASMAVLATGVLGIGCVWRRRRA